ncbi:MAG: MBL fold metallo-hydrolase [Gemmatimonadaceae bacterium]
MSNPDTHQTSLIVHAQPSHRQAIIANVRALGFLIEDVRLIVNSHAHVDHAGGIAELQKASGAEVAASPPSAWIQRARTAVVRHPDHAASQRIKSLEACLVTNARRYERLQAVCVERASCVGEARGHRARVAVAAQRDNRSSFGGRLPRRTAPATGR